MWREVDPPQGGSLQSESVYQIANKTFLIKKASLCLVINTLLCGCVFSYPTNLRFVSAERSDLDDLSKPTELANIKNLNQTLLKVLLTSDIDLLDYGMGSYGISARGGFCNERDKIPAFVGSPSPDLAWNGVFSGSLNLGSYISEHGLFLNPTEKSDAISAGPQLKTGPGGEKLYYVYLITFRATPTPGAWSHPEQSWDLTERPHDVCLQIGTLKQYLFPRRSNILRIPESLIRATLHR